MFQSKFWSNMWFFPVSLLTWCQLIDKTGPFDSKYCGDGGVYYTYNFIEQQGGGGGVGWPWGADQLAPRAGVNLTVSLPIKIKSSNVLMSIFQWVTEASAKSYQLMKQLHLDPFNFTQTLGTATYLNQTFTHRPEGKDLSEMYGRYPGSWTLPVCNASDWGYVKYSLLSGLRCAALREGIHAEHGCL